MIRNGFTLIEMILVVATLGILAAIALPVYTDAVDKGRIADASADISDIMQSIERFYVANNRYPDSLAEVGANTKLDPWGQPYKYFRIYGNSSDRYMRFDQGLQPINTDFDLYSHGKDTFTTLNISQSTGRDDVIRGRNGRYIGLGKDF